MTDPQQSAIRFRVPRLRPSLQNPRTTTATRITARKPRVLPLPQSSTQPQSTSPAPPTAQAPRPQEPPTPTPGQVEPPVATLRQPEPPVATPRQPEPPAPTPRQPEPPAPTPRQPEPLAPPPRQPEPPAPTPRKPEPPSPTPRKPEPPAPTTQRPEQPAPTPRQPEQPAPTPRQPGQPAPTQRPQELPATTPQEPPASPPTLVVKPSPSQREPPVQPSLSGQDEPASMTTKPVQAGSLFSTAEPSDLTKPTSPSTIIQTSSPPHSYPSQPPEVKMSTKIDSNNNGNNKKGSLNAAPNQDQTSTELPNAHCKTESGIEENQHENQEAICTMSNIPNTPQTKSVISHPDCRIPEPASPVSRKLDGPQLHKCEETPPNQSLNEKPAVITVAGDNRGASMHIGTGKTKREKSIHINRRYKVNFDESTDTMTDDDQEKENNVNEENFSNINCNIQGINNSIVFNCTITERSPGVHFGFCDVKKSKQKSTDMKRLKVNYSPISKKHTIRRRCLRGLFMESSDHSSDQNDHLKPRRHGCRYVGQDQSNKDDKMDI